MDWGTWIAFLGASVLLTLMPGPDILFVITQSVTGSRKDGIAVALGLCTGLLAHIGAAALGVSAVVYRSDLAFQTVKALGAAYLFYLAWQSWLSSSSKEGGEPEGTGARPEGSGSDRPAERRLPFGRLYRRGILMNVMNPKVSLFFVAFLPQFIVPDGGPVPLQMIVLGGSFLLQALAIFVVIAFAAGSLGRQWIGGAAAHRWTARIQAVIYALLGAQMLFLHLL